MKKIIYILTLLFFSLGVGIAGGIVDIMQTPEVVEASKKLGYPLYFFTLLGVFKIVGGIVLLLPKRFMYYKDIAFAGFGVDFIFASYSHFMVGDDTLKVIIPLVLLVLLVASYHLGHPKNKEEN